MDFLTIIYAIIFLGIMIFVHEFGHYSVARLLKVPIDEFSIGFGPEIAGWERKGIKYSLRLFFAGGYVRFFGDFEETDDEKAFANQKAYKRFLTLFAGPAMNILFAVLLYFLFIANFGLLETVPSIANIYEDSAAMTAGVEVDEIITEIDGQSVEYSYEGIETISVIFDEKLDAEGKDAVFVITLENPEGETKTIETGLIYNEENDRYMFGIEFGYKVVEYSLADSVVLSFKMTANITGEMLSYLKNMFSTGEGLSDVTGPVGIINIVSDAARQGIERLIQVAIVITLNLGIMNLLPISMLDGGRILIVAVEVLRGKPLPQKFEETVMVIGFFILLAVMVVVTFKDIFFPVALP